MKVGKQEIMLAELYQWNKKLVSLEPLIVKM